MSIFDSIACTLHALSEICLFLFSLINVLLLFVSYDCLCDFLLVHLLILNSSSRVVVCHRFHALLQHLWVVQIPSLPFQPPLGPLQTLTLGPPTLQPQTPLAPLPEGTIQSPKACILTLSMLSLFHWLKSSGSWMPFFKKTSSGPLASQAWT